MLTNRPKRRFGFGVKVVLMKLSLHSCFLFSSAINQLMDSRPSDVRSDRRFRKSRCLGAGWERRRESSLPAGTGVSEIQTIGVFVHLYRNAPFRVADVVEALSDESIASYGFATRADKHLMPANKYPTSADRFVTTADKYPTTANESATSADLSVTTPDNSAASAGSAATAADKSAKRAGRSAMSIEGSAAAVDQRAITAVGFAKASVDFAKPVCGSATAAERVTTKTGFGVDAADGGATLVGAATVLSRLSVSTINADPYARANAQLGNGRFLTKSEALAYGQA
jgi:hypothetical protein